MQQAKHIAIIMDGNGRWAKQRGFKERIKGHEVGASKVRELTIHSSNIGLKYLTLYAFSTENWKRPKAEVTFLMNLMDKYLKNELPLFLENSVKFETIGDISALSTKLQDRIAHTKAKTAHFDGLTQVLAINYGAKDEIVRSINKAIKIGEEVDEKSFGKLLDTKNMPDVDILIRTGGDVRISNYLLWQCAYSEMFFTPTLWPDFSTKEFDEILANFGKIERRFGGVI